jgi:hypothetical protein
MKRVVISVFLVAAIILIAASGCEKDFNFAPISKGQEPNGSVELKYSKGIIFSGDTIYGDSAYYFGLWLTPSTGTSIATGTFEIKYQNNIIYLSSAPENGIDWKAPYPGEFDLDVTGNFQGTPFSYTNIKIFVTGGAVPTLATSPVRLSNFIVSGGMASVDIAVSKAEHIQFTNSTWFYVRRVNNMNWSTNNSVVNQGDSVFFTLTFPATNLAYAEFNVAYHDGSVGGMWLTPSAGNPPSILYSGSQNIPYNGSGSFFGLRLHILSPSQSELRTHSGVLLLSTGTAANPIPGNNGDGIMNNYQVRWSGFAHWFKTSLASPTFRYKIGINGTWAYLSAQQWAQNPDYFQVEIPIGTIGELRFQFGTGTGSSFIPATGEMSNSMYYEAVTTSLVRNV